MSDKPFNDYAFPYSVSGAQRFGMTLRDYFAAKAMEGLLSVPSARDQGSEGLAEEAYRIADKMLQARDS